MKNFKITQVLLIAVLVLFSCNKSGEEAKSESSKAEESLAQSSDFKLREFKPYLGEKWIGNAIAYGPYREGQAPGGEGPTNDQIIEDLDIIVQNWNLIRLYNADDVSKQILEVIRNNNYQIKVMLGVWLENQVRDSNKIEENLKNVETAIDLANEYKDEIIAVSVGNEAQVFWSWHRMDVNKQIEYIQKVRENISQPVTVADDYKFWLDDSSKTVANEIDFITTHAHPAWNGLQLDNSIPWLDSVYKEVSKIHSDKLVIIGEHGWPTDFAKDQIGDGQQGSLIKGEINAEAQKKYFDMYNKWLSETKTVSFLFEIFDEPWKGGGASRGKEEVEKNWGIYYENRQPKF